MDAASPFGQILAAMADKKTEKLSWPWWSSWTLLAIAATALLTVAVTLYDIR
jgi:hypothetical protein